MLYQLSYASVLLVKWHVPQSSIVLPARWDKH